MIHAEWSQNGPDVFRCPMESVADYYVEYRASIAWSCNGLKALLGITVNYLSPLKGGIGPTSPPQVGVSSLLNYMKKLVPMRAQPAD